MNYFIKSAICLFLFVLVTSCSSTRLTKVIILPIEQYKYYKEMNGLRIAIDPYFDPDRIKKTFGVNLLDDNILPIFILTENHNTDTSFYIKKDAICLSFLTVTELEKLKAENITLEQLESAIYNLTYPYIMNFRNYLRGQYGGNINLYPLIANTGELILAIWGVGMTIKELSNMQKTEIIEHNIVKQTLMEKTINPGGSNSGFVYVKIKDINEHNYLFFIQATDFKSNKDINFYYIISE